MVHRSIRGQVERVYRDIDSKRAAARYLHAAAITLGDGEREGDVPPAAGAPRSPAG